GYRRGRGEALHQQRPVARSAATGAPDYQPATQPGDRTRRTLRCSTADANAGNAALTVLRTIPPAPRSSAITTITPSPTMPRQDWQRFRLRLRSQPEGHGLRTSRGPLPVPPPGYVVPRPVWC